MHRNKIDMAQFPPVDDGHSRFNQAFFEQAIERYEKTKVRRANNPGRLDGKIPPQKRLRSSIEPLETLANGEASPMVGANKNANLDGKKNDATDVSSELEKKRRASRVSSRRTRERENLRVNHFQKVKSQLETDNSKLRDENQQLRDLIKKMKEENKMFNLKMSAVQSLLANQPTGTSSSFINHNLAPLSSMPQHLNAFHNTSNAAASASCVSGHVQAVQLTQQPQQPQHLLNVLRPFAAMHSSAIPIYSNPAMLSILMAGANNLNSAQLTSAGEANLATIESMNRSSVHTISDEGNGDGDGRITESGLPNEA